MTGLWWAWKGEEKTLPWSVKAFRIVFPSVRVAIFDQGGDRLPTKVLRDIDPDSYHVTEVDRRGNLIGPKWIAYQFQVYNQLAKIGPIIKTDPDYLHLNADIFAGQHDLCGYETHLPNTVGGHTYCLGVEGAKQALKFSLGRGWPEGRVAEDYETSVAVASRIGSIVRTVPSGHYTHWLSKDYNIPATLEEYGILHSGRDKEEMAELMEQNFHEHFPGC